jgi:predicted aspartyl protease
MTKLIVPFETVPRLFVQVFGESGKMRELMAVIDPASVDVVIPRVDALHLGYPAYLDLAADKQSLNVTLGLTLSSLIEVAEFPLAELRVGEISLKGVSAVAYDTPLQAGVDVILGCSFLERFRTTIDYERKLLTLEELPQPKEHDAVPEPAAQGASPTQ